MDEYPGLLVTAPSPGWRGLPLAEVEVAGTRYLVLGELGRAERNDGDRRQGGGLTAVLSQPPHHWNGHFLVLAWEGVTRRWHLWTNRFGTVHAYLGSGGGQAAVGTYFPSVAAVASRRQLDWQGVIGFFAFGFFPQDRTFFADVRMLRPATHSIFDVQGRLEHQERYWYWRHQPQTNRSFDDTVAEFADVFHDVMGDSVKGGRTALPVSGGLDSRSTVAALSREGAAASPRESLWAYSYGYTGDSVETRIAARVAKAAGLSLSRFTITPYLFDLLPQALAYTEGFQDVTQCRQLFVRDRIAAEAKGVINALWGDVWLDSSGGGQAGATVPTRAQLAVQKFSKRGSEWLLQRIKKEAESAATTPLLTEMMERELKRLGDGIEDEDFRLKALKTEQWSWRWSLPAIRVFQSAATPKLVFYDTRLTDFFATVPSSFLVGRRLQVEYLKRYAPTLARVTWQAYGANLYLYRYINARWWPWRAAGKLSRVLTGRKPIQRNWEAQFLGAEGQQGLRNWLLKPGLRLHEYFSPSELARLLEVFWTRPRADSGYTVSMLLTFSAWLELHA